MVGPAQLGEHADTVERAAASLYRYGSVGRAWSLEVARRLADARGGLDPDAWAQVVAAWREVGFPYHRASTQLAHARALLATGDRTVARSVLAEAWETAKRLGATPLADQVLGCAASGRVSLEGARRADAPGKLGVLTARERDVLGLVAVGKTNDQIASQLFISPKTVSVHVSRIIAKLGVANRTEASAYAHRHGMA
jgi:DNA-binding CsgD family transcriptional regulator